MCGIFGRLEPPGTAVDGGLLRRQTDTLTHRGPDAGGYWAGSRQYQGIVAVDADPVVPEGAHLALGHRRLSILDLSTAAVQPLCDAGHRAWIVFNGEIYNFAALRKELVGLGARFLTDHSDTEVLLQAWLHWGEDCLKRLRGMFAFLIVDLSRGVAFMARDRVGKKPFYYTVTPSGGLMVGSELKALVEDPAVPRLVDPVALSQYLQSGNVLSPRTAYDGVYKLPPAHAAVVPLDEPSRLRVWRYWHPPVDQDTTTPPQELRERFEATFQEAVSLRMVADVPVGAFLSGGIDSTRVSRAIHQLGGDLNTFSIGFQEAAFNELPYADKAAKHYGVHHHTQIVGPQNEDLLDLLAFHYDEPFGDSSAIPTYALCRFARQRVTVALSGDGGDEITAGYYRYKVYEVKRLLSRFFPVPFRRYVMEPVARALPDGIRGVNFLRHIARNERESYYTHMFQHHAADLLPDALRHGVQAAARQPFDGAWDEGPKGAAAHVRRLQHTDLLTYLPEDILTKVDRASMAVALEARCPLLDHEVVEQALRLPSPLTYGGGEQKAILKEPLRRELGDGFVDRQKMGFGVPVGQWFAGPWRGRIQRLLSADRTLPGEVIDPVRLGAMAGAHGGFTNYSAPLYYVVMLALWWERWQPTGVAEPRDLPVPWAER